MVVIGDVAVRRDQDVAADFHVAHRGDVGAGVNGTVVTDRNLDRIADRIECVEPDVVPYVDPLAEDDVAMSTDHAGGLDLAAATEARRRRIICLSRISGSLINLRAYDRRGMWTSRTSQELGTDTGERRSPRSTRSDRSTSVSLSLG